MSTNKTTNYNLHSWVGTDYVKREEFNENFTTIDTTLKSANDAIATKAASNHTHPDATTTTSGLMSGADKTKLNGVAAGAEVNQNTFANVKVGTTTIAADSKTDTLEFVAGTNVVLTPDATNDKVTITLSGSVETTAGSQAKADAAATSANAYTDSAVAAVVFPVTSVAGKTGAVTLAATDVGAAPSSHVGAGGTAHAAATTSTAGFMAATDKVKLDGIATGAQTNQNAFSNIKVGATTVAADNATDTFEMVAGTNVVLTPDATNDRVTIALSSSVETTAGAQSKADTAESRAKAASLPSTSARISTVDLNTFVTSGEFALGSSLTNAPSGFSFGTLFVSNSSSDRITQTAYAPGQSKTFIRYGAGSPVVWTAWVENETVDGSQAKVDIHAADSVKHITSAERSTWNGKASTAVATTSANGLMSSTDKTKLDGVAAGANNYVHPSTHPATMITEDSSHRFATDAEKAAWNAKAGTAVATTSVNGLMAAVDKTKLDGISTGANKVTNPATNGVIAIDGVNTTVYTHPATHAPSIITQDASNRFVTDTEKATWNNKADKVRKITAGTGLVGGGDLSADRTLAVNFDDNGFSDTVARGDHTHQYVSQYGDYMSGNLTIMADAESLTLDGTTHAYLAFRRGTNTRMGYIGVGQSTTNAVRLSAEQGWLDLLGKDGVNVYAYDSDGTPVSFLRADGTKEASGVHVELGGGSRTHIYAGESTVNPETNMGFNSTSESLILESNNNIFVAWNTNSAFDDTKSLVFAGNVIRPQTTAGNAVIDLGASGYRWRTIYATNALNTSDSAYKENIALLNGKTTEAELKYDFVDIKDLPREDAIANPDEVLEYLLSMPLYAFDYKEMTEGNTQFGFMADQLLSDDPSNVAKRFVYDTEAGATVSTQSYASAIHIAFQRYVEKQNQEMASMRSEIDELKAVVNTLLNK